MKILLESCSTQELDDGKGMGYVLGGTCHRILRLSPSLFLAMF